MTEKPSACSTCGSPRHESSDHGWHTDEYLAAADEFQRASEQVELYAKVRHTSLWAEDQYQTWLEIREAHRWTEPGA